MPDDSSESHIAAAKAVLEIEIGELQRMAGRINGSFADAIELLSKTLDAHGKIVVMGVGKSENIATKIVATFNSTGAPAVVLNCQNALHGDLGIVVAGDVVLALSYSGETGELLELLPHLKRRGVWLLAMTGRADSTLARNSDIVLDVHVDSEACPLNLAPTSSTTNMLALGDALAMVLLKARGVEAEDFAELHPAGAIGRRLLTLVADIMRQDDRLAVVNPEDTVSTALEAMTRCRAGAVVIVHPDGSLAGIFTHGDFVRAYQSDRAVADAAVGAHMTAAPVAIRDDRLAAEAVNVLEQNQIDEIVVVDDENRPVGLIDVQDLSRERIY